MKVIVYQFLLRGELVELDDEKIADCYPSISDKGSYFFQLVDGSRFRGENVKQVIRDSASIMRYQLSN